MRRLLRSSILLLAIAVTSVSPLRAQIVPEDSLSTPDDGSGLESTGSTSYALNAYRTQPEVWSFARPVEPGVDAYGDLNLSVPVLTVPGRGMNYDVVFDYRSSIPMMQPASWIGLGWSFDPGSISREAEGGAVKGTSGYGIDMFDAATDKRQPDVFYVTIPGQGSVEVAVPNVIGYNTYNTTIPIYQAGGYMPTEHKPWVITASATGAVTVGTCTRCTTGTQTDANGTFQTKTDIRSFTVRTEDGTRYVFAKPTLSFFDAMKNDTHLQIRQIGVSSWRLVAILGTDWDGANAELPADTDGGTWIRFEYTTESTATSISYHGIVQAVSQVRYLSKIVTPTHTAEFALGSRQDATVPDYEHFANLHKRLTGIKLYSRLNGGYALVEEVVLQHNNYAASDLGHGPTKSGGRGRLRLDEMKFYDTGGSASGAARPGYKFAYHPQAAQVEVTCFDHFGYYSFTSLSSGCNGGPTVDPTGGRAWSLSRIDYPSGGFAAFSYETDKIDVASVSFTLEHLGTVYTNQPYQLIADYQKRQGGARVTSITRDNAMGSSAVTTYSYGRGALSGVPSGYWPKLAPAGVLRHFTGSNRGKVAVVYEHITEKRPDNSKIIRYFTTSYYGSPVTPVKTLAVQHQFTANGFVSYCNESTGSGDVQCHDIAVIQGNQHWNWARLYKTIFRNASGHKVREVITDVNLTEKPSSGPSAVSPIAQSWDQSGSASVPVAFGEYRVTKETTREYLAPDSINAAVLTVTYTHDGRTNLVKETLEEGQNLARFRTLEFAHDAQYGQGTGSEIRTLNMLSQIAREDISLKTGSSTRTYYASNVTTWRKPPGRNYWRPWRDLRWNAASPATTKAAFTEWITTTVPAGWIESTVYETYDAHGHVTRQRDARGEVLKFYYGSNASNFSNSVTNLKYALLTGVRLVKDTSDPDTVDYLIAIDFNGTFGKPIQLTDEGGTNTYFDYDAFARLWKRRSSGTDVLAEYAYAFPVFTGSTITTPGIITTKPYISATTTLTSRQYFDGLARLIQTQLQDGSNDVVTATTYNAQGLAWKEYKPYLQSNSTHVYRSSFDTEAKAYYDGTPGPVSNGYPYTESRYQTDPLDRVSVALPPGTSSETSSQRFAYGIEAMTLPWDGTSRRYVFTETTDETGKKVRSYQDALGNPIRTISAYGTVAPITTNMQYDVLGRLVKTYAPEWTSGTAHTTSYTYDTLSRLTAKTSPDAGTVQYKYDKAGNVRFSQDAVQAAAGKVLFITYDFANRPLRTGEASATFSSLDPNVVHAFENSTANWLRLARYDSQPDWDAYPWYYFNSGFGTLSSIQGRLVATIEKSNGTWQVTAYSYDTRGRVSTKYVRMQNAAGFNTTYVYTYDFQDRLMRVHTTVSTQSFYQWYDYDAPGRLWKVFTATTATKPASPDVTYTYTPAGRISQEAYLGGTTIPVKYTIRDWVDTIDNLTTPSKSFAAKYLYFANGNVQESHFRQTSSPAANKQYRYVFTYDGANRLTAADHWTYTTAWSNVANYDVAGISYDDNGNLKNLQRYRESGMLVDNLTYTYTSGTNRLASISDAVAATTETWDAESGSFTYNLNGAMLTAPAPYSISATTYDYRSLPTAITRMGTTTQYRYSSDGQRYFKKTGSSAGEHYVLDGAVTMGLFTEAGALTHWNVVANGSVIGRREASGAKRFYVKDHLGSTRMVVTDAGAVVETSDYYPFGLAMPGRGYVTGTAAKEKFTGKERDVETGLDYFGARYYMAAVGRWGVVDPRAEKYPAWSPYNYALDNPLLYVDPRGDTVKVGYIDSASGSGPQHSLLVHVDNDTGRQRTIVEGMPTSRTSGVAGLLVSAAISVATLNPGTAIEATTHGTGFGNLESKIVTPGESLSPQSMQVVPIPEGMTETSFLRSINDSYTSYDNSVGYAIFPTGEKGNSNSLVGSVLRASGSNFQPDRMVPGWSVNVLPSQRSK